MHRGTCPPLHWTHMSADRLGRNLTIICQRRDNRTGRKSEPLGLPLRLPASGIVMVLATSVSNSAAMRGFFMLRGKFQ